MGPDQTYKLLYSKGNHKQNEKTTYRMVENICKWCDQQGLNFQNIQTAHTTQQQKNKQLKNKINSPTDESNTIGERISNPENKPEKKLFKMKHGGDKGMEN